MDIVSPARRSEMMGRIKSKNTAPELCVRRLAHRLGYRFRLHRRDLPGSPDLVFSAQRKAVFVHGCFWHRHEGCRLAYTPKSNQEFWEAKFRKNVERDGRAKGELERMGWDVVVIWECEATNRARLALTLEASLGHAR